MFITEEYELFKGIGLPCQVTFIFSYPSLVTFLFVSILLNGSCSFSPLHPFYFPPSNLRAFFSLFLSENLPAGIFHESICIELFIDTIKSAFV